MKEKSFTLIELLVVVAIIGLMASIVLVNIRDTRAKARDAQIQSLMHQVRNAAEMSYNRDETYSKVCGESDDTLRDMGDFKLLENAIMKENGDQPVTCYEGQGRASFVASSPLVFRKGKHWCIESAGFSIEIDNPVEDPGGGVAKCE